MNKLKILLAGLILVAMFAAGLGIAWMADAQNTKALTGQVTDELTKQPVAGAIVHVSWPGEAAHDFRTDDNGHYRAGFSTGPLSITVEARGFQPTTGVFAAADTLVREFPLDIVLRPYVVSGVVKDDSSQQPVVSATLTAGDASTQTAGDGRFTLERVQPGTTLRAEAGGYYPHEVQWNGNGALEFQLSPKTIAVVVTSASDATPLKANVLVNGTKYQTDVQGRVAVREPDPNTQIVASADEFASSAVSYGGQALVEISLKPSAFKAVVRDAKTGKPIAGATIFVAGAVAMSTGDDGKFGLSTATPGISLTVKAAGYALYHTVVPVSPTADLALTPFTARGVYLPFGLLASETRVRALIDMVDHTTLNTLVVDVKSDRGLLAFHSDNPIIKAVGAEDVRMDLRTLLRLAHDKNIYVIARIVTFKDEPLARARPDLAVKSKNGTIWRDSEQLAWANPYLHEVWDYNIAIAKEVAALGFDEIQFDYIRFPSDGNVNAIYFQPPHTADTRAAALRGFLNAVDTALKPYPVFISADIFGMTIWTHDDMGIGQHLEDVAPRVDYVQPMIYPSTFSSDNLGYANPPAHPYDVIYRSVKTAAARVSTLIRPWLQAYSIHNAPYGMPQFLLQKQGANDAGSAGWTFWNAGGTYDPALFASP